tara:strand:+ start:58 stop:516 length:459 start_codon:yes stop_codon:yes gene_type:complete
MLGEDKGILEAARQVVVVFQVMELVVVMVRMGHLLLTEHKEEVPAQALYVLEDLVVVVEPMETPVVVVVVGATQEVQVDITALVMALVVVADRTTADPIKAIKQAFGIVTVRLSSKHVLAFVLKGLALQTITPTPMLPYQQEATAQTTVQVR